MRFNGATGSHPWKSRGGQGTGDILWPCDRDLIRIGRHQGVELWLLRECTVSNRSVLGSRGLNRKGGHLRGVGRRVRLRRSSLRLRSTRSAVRKEDRIVIKSVL